MRVAVVSCVYPPEPAVSARTSSEIAHELAARGHDVTVLCPFPSRPAGRLYAGFRRTWRHVVNEASVRVERRWSTVSRDSTLASRFAENLSFGITSALALLRMRRPDVAYLNSWPLFATALAAAVLRARRVPYVVSIQDVYPESLFVQKRAGVRIAGRLLRALDRSIAKRAAAVIVLSRAFAGVYERDRGLARSAIHVIPNWIAGNEVQPDPEGGRRYRRARGIPEDAYVVAYGGNVGVAAGVEQLIEAFRSLDERFHLIVAGSGARLAACEALARDIAPSRIHFESPWEPATTSMVLSAGDLLALPTAGEQSRVSVPSKLLTYLLMDKPIVALATPDSEVARILDESGAGRWVERDLAKAIFEARESLVQGGRAYVLETFARDACLPSVVALLEDACV